MKTFPFLPLVPAVLLSASPMSAQPDPLQGLDADIRQSMAELHVPGLAIAVVKDDEVVFLKGYGVRELGKDATVDEHTVFRLGSTTKAFTAAAVGLLVDEGKLSWDDPVIQHLPWFRLSDPWVTRMATLRDLLSHRLVGEVGSGFPFLAQLTSIEREDVLKRLGDLEPRPGRFRSRFQYCNACYALAGEVVEAVSGMSWEDFVRARILIPLGMTSASTSVYDIWEAEDVASCFVCDLPGRTVGFEDARVQNVAMPHLSRGFSDDDLHPIPWRRIGVTSAGGAVNTSAADLAKWLRFQLGKGVYEGEQILSAGVVEEMHSAQVVTPTWWRSGLVGQGFGHFWAYGFGWFLTDYQGRRTAFHEGGGGGVSTFVALIPDDKVGVAVLTNSALNRLPQILGFAVLSAYLDAPTRDWRREGLSRVKANRERYREQQQARERALQAGRVQGTTPSLPIEAYVGEYWHPGVGRMTLTKEEGILVLRYPGSAYAGDLEHWHHDVYRVTQRDPEGWQLFMTFVINEAGQVDEFRMRELVFQRLPDPSE